MAISRTTFDEQFAAATRRGEQRLASEPCAVAARYDRQKRVVVIDLSSGCSLLLPPGLAQGLSDASPVELGEISILGPGTSISWPRLDVQFSIAGLLAGALGTRQWMTALDRSKRRAAKPRTVSRNGSRSRGHKRTSSRLSRSARQGRKLRK